MRVGFVYRGPLERQRLTLILMGAARAFGPVKFRWLVPWGRSSTPPTGAYADFLGWNDAAIEDHGELDGSTCALGWARRYLADDLGPLDVVISFGFTSILYTDGVPAARCVWVVNGLPEERLLHRDGLRTRATIRAQYGMVRRSRRPDLVVVVSEGMRELLARRLWSFPSLIIPSCTDMSAFTPVGSPTRRFLTYVGSGAPWQCLDQLEGVWAELAAREPSLEFRVVSRDDRTRVLGQRIPEGRFHVRSAESARQVAPFLWEAEAGFLIRRPNVINSLAAPAKFSEYVAAGAAVVATDTGWDVATFVRETRCGLVLDPSSSPAVMAERYLAFRAGGGLLEAQRASLEAAPRLDRSLHADRLAASLQELRPRGVGAA